MRIDQISLDAFLVFCRVGACFMIVPGVSSARIPMRFRLYLALVMALVITPVVDLQGERPRDINLLRIVAGEMLIGLALGAVVRLLIEAIEFFGTAISNYIGLSGISGAIEDGHVQPAVSMLISAIAILLLILMDVPLHLVASVVRSYSDLPLAAMPDTAAMLRMITTSLSAAFVVGLQISAPFIIYSIVINAMFGILGRLVPQLPSYFVSVPFLALGGLALLLLVMGQLVLVMGSAFSQLALP